MAGHSKWANIKHRKARNDAKRGKTWSKCSRAIVVAARSGGGDPASNLSLRYAIEEARSANMPKETIQNAVKKGTGDLDGASYESFIYEGYGPGGVAVLLDILTDNRNRTAGEIRKIFEKDGGNLGATGCVAYLFEPMGQIFIARQGADEELVMETALEGGAQDVLDETDSWRIITAPGDFMGVRDALEMADFTIESAQISQIPSTTITCRGHEARKLLALLEVLEDHDDVQKVYANFDIPDAEMAAMEG